MHNDPELRRLVENWKRQSFGTSQQHRAYAITTSTDVEDLRARVVASGWKSLDVTAWNLASDPDGPHVTYVEALRKLAGDLLTRMREQLARDKGISLDAAWDELRGDGDSKTRALFEYYAL